MALKKLSSDAFRGETSEGKWVICFGAQWCVPCKQVEPILEDISEDNDFQGISFAKLDIEQSHDIARQFFIYSVPAILFMNNGSIESMHNGSISKYNLKEKVVSLLK